MNNKAVGLRSRPEFIRNSTCISQAYQQFFENMNLSGSFPVSGPIRLNSVEHSFLADVFIDVWPVGADAFPDQSEILPLCFACLA
jgi:hypothetical protein